MAKRKYPKVRPAVKFMKPVPDLCFHCPCCDHETGVLCYMYFDDRIGELYCRICHARYSTLIDIPRSPLTYMKSGLKTQTGRLC
uniref:Transcription elongation factor 1 homolog n=1 Tax=Elaeis guineensis var. tenera TaxID=51953 RepID=A0A6I9QK18_ELAGV|nr:transcription elongation factor 1 homolog isoform X2 [Elaeis guineensis]